MPRTSDARQKMIVSQALLQRERGVAATTLPDVLEHSGAPRGSIYHHFPGGRAQLAAEATEFAADFITARLAEALKGGDLGHALEVFIDDWGQALRDSEFAAGCPVVAGALDASEDPGARQAAVEGLERWQTLVGAALVREGASKAQAKSLATTIIAAIEGAIVLARAEGDLRPLNAVGAQLHGLVALAIAGSPQDGRPTAADENLTE